MEACLVLDDAVGDPIADVIGQREITGISIKSLSEFLSACGIEAGSDGRLSVAASAATPPRVIDRVVEVSPKTLEAIGGPDTLIQRGQVLAAYEFLIRGTYPLSERRQYTTLGKLLPLPTQWTLVENSIPGVAVPIFRYGYGPELVTAEGFPSPIFKSPFDLYSWKPNERAEGQVWDDLVLSRPEGRPVLSFSLGGEVIVEPLDGIDGPIAQAALLTAVFPSVLDVFAANLGEVLWFVAPNQVTFAAFSHFLSGAAKSKRFPDEAELYVRRFLDANPTD